VPIGEGPATAREHDAAPRARLPQKTRAGEAGDRVRALHKKAYSNAVQGEQNVP